MPSIESCFLVDAMACTRRLKRRLRAGALRRKPIAFFLRNLPRIDLRKVRRRRPKVRLLRNLRKAMVEWAITRFAPTNTNNQADASIRRTSVTCATHFYVKAGKSGATPLIYPARQAHCHKRLAYTVHRAVYKGTQNLRS